MTDTLDDPGLLDLDRSGMFGHIRNVSGALADAWEKSAGLAPPKIDELAQVVIAGVGGSATAGDYFAALVAHSSTIPVSVVRAYPLPAYVSSHTLVVVCSYSGNTEESLAAYEDARARGAAIVVISRGGTLVERATTHGHAWCPLTYEAPPRATTMHTLGPLLRLGQLLGLLTIGLEQLTSAARRHAAFVAAELETNIPGDRNPAKQLAHALQGRFPLFIGAEHLIPAAVRMKNQAAENGKSLGAAESLPEAGHNLIVGLATGRQAADHLSLVTLESPALYQPRTQQGFDVLTAQFAEQYIPVHRLSAPGETALDEILWATAMGDYMSCYLALLNGVDPTPIPQIEAFRQRNA